MTKILQQLNWNRAIYALGLVLFGVLILKGKAVPDWLQTILLTGAGGALVTQGFTPSVAKKDEEKSE